MLTYTVFNPDQPVDTARRGLTAVEAMSEILTHDGYRYEIRRADFRGKPCWELWHSDGSENSSRGARHMVKTVVFSLEPDEATATQEIAREVVTADWPRLPDCMTDEAYDAMLADSADEEG